MRSALLPLALTSCLWGACQVEVEPPPRLADATCGLVRETTSPAPGESSPTDETIERSFNDLGQLLSQEVRWSPGDQLRSRDEFFWNDDDKVVRWDRDSNGNGTVGRVLEYRYDDAGRLSIRVRVDVDTGEEVGNRLEYTYDESGFISRYRYVDLYERESDRWDYSRDDAGRVLEERWYSARDLRSTSRFEYRTDGQMARSEHESAEGSTYSQEYLYDDEGRPVQLVLGDGEVARTVTYDEQGRVVRRVAGTWEETFEYDAAGNLVVEERRSDGELSSRDEYEYDERGLRIAHISRDDALAVTSLWTGEWQCRLVPGGWVPKHPVTLPRSGIEYPDL
jgi:YD repeat-containing protein